MALVIVIILSLMLQFSVSILDTPMGVSAPNCSLCRQMFYLNRAEIIDAIVNVPVRPPVPVLLTTFSSEEVVTAELMGIINGDPRNKYETFVYG